MTPRERVNTALAHRTPDRAPIDLWGTASRLCDKLYFEVVSDQGWKDLGKFDSASRHGFFCAGSVFER